MSEEVQTDNVEPEVEQVDFTTETESEAPTPEPTQPAPEPEPMIEPDWLDSVGAVEEPDEPRGRRREEYYDEPQRGYQQQPQHQPEDTETRLRRFVQDPDRYIDTLVEQRFRERFDQSLGPVAYQLQQIDQRTNTWLSAQAENAIAKAKDDVSRAYRDVFSKDDGFRRNDKVRKQVETTLRGMLNQATAEARGGYPQKLMMFSHPGFYNTFLAAAKAYTGYQPQANAPAQPVGAVVEGATAPQAADHVELPPDLESVAKRMGPAYRKKLEKEYKESQKRGDIEFWE